MNDRDRVPDPLEFWEYASLEEINRAIEDDRIAYEGWLNQRDLPDFPN